MTDKEKQEKTGRRLLFNKTGMAFNLRPGPDGEKRILQVGTAIEPLDDKEEKDLLDYSGIVYADTIMPVTNTAQQLAEAKKRVAELTKENEELRGSLAAGVSGGKGKKDSKAG